MGIQLHDRVDPTARSPYGKPRDVYADPQLRMDSLFDSHFVCAEVPVLSKALEKPSASSFSKRELLVWTNDAER